VATGGIAAANPWGAMILGGSCGACAAGVGTSAHLLMSCLEAHHNVMTTKRCQEEWAALPFVNCLWGDAVVGKWEHSCRCQCIDDKCTSYCTRLAQNKGIQLLTASAGACSSDNKCICNFDPDSFCSSSDAAAAGTAYCGGGKIDPSTGKITCPTSVCRNATVDRSCGTTARNEVCDPLATPNGCPQGQRCSDDCGTCIDACPDGICDPSIGEDQPSSPNYCQADCASTCGDGVCQNSQGELDSSSPNYCPQDCTVGVDCCTQNFGCPKEGLYTCTGSPCCCCPSGQRCVGSPQGGWACGN
jgi:hypothetical protein